MNCSHSPVMRMGLQDISADPLSKSKLVALPLSLVLLSQPISKHQIILEMASTLLMKWEVSRAGHMVFSLTVTLEQFFLDLYQNPCIYFTNSEVFQL